MSSVDRILKLIEDKKILKKDFLSNLKLDKNALSDWENGKTQSYRKYINQIAEYLNTSVSYLLCETDDSTPPNKEPAPELYPGQAQDLAKIYEELETLDIEQLKIIKKFVKSLKSESD